MPATLPPTGDRTHRLCRLCHRGRALPTMTSIQHFCYSLTPPLLDSCRLVAGSSCLPLWLAAVTDFRCLDWFFWRPATSRFGCYMPACLWFSSPLNFSALSTCSWFFVPPGSYYTNATKLRSYHVRKGCFPAATYRIPKGCLHLRVTLKIPQNASCIAWFGRSKTDSG